jgi:predicted transcriptional regulator
MKTKCLTFLCLFILFAIAVRAQKVQLRSVPERVKLSINKIATPLKLDSSQLGRVESAFAEYYEAQNKIFAETKATGIRPNYTVFEKILDQRDAKLKMILTPGQYTKFKNEVEENLRPQIKNHDD